MSDEEIRAELAALQERQVAALERIEAALMARLDEMATEVRTRRLVIVDETGFERIVGNAGDRSASIKLHGKPLPGQEHDALEVLIDVSEESHAPDAGVHLSARGDFLASLIAVDEEGPGRVSLNVGEIVVHDGPFG